MIKAKPILKSIIWTLIILCFPVVSAVISLKLELNNTQTMFLQGCFMFSSLIIPIIYLRKYKISFKEIGLTNMENRSAKKVLFFLPPIISVVPFLLVGINLNSIKYIMTLLFFTLAIGISEEVYFRGVILNLLVKKYPIKKSIVISALIFGAGHIASILAGTSILTVLLQMINAFVFGIITAEIVTITKSIIPTIIWHFVFNFVNYITLANGINEIIATGFQVIIMIIYAYNLWGKISLKNSSI